MTLTAQEEAEILASIDAIEAEPDNLTKLLLAQVAYRRFNTKLAGHKRWIAWFNANYRWIDWAGDVPD